MTENVQKKTKKNWKQLRLSLKYRPKIYRLIMKMRQCIRKKTALIKCLKVKLNQLESNPSMNNVDKTHKDSSIQTGSIDEKKTVPNSKDAGWLDSSKGENEKSIAEQVKEVAQNALQETGMVYVESARMYYDYKTGYYYNSELGLYYHTDTNCYYYYSDDKKQFEFHSYPDTSSVHPSLIAHQKKKARKLKRDKPKRKKIKKKQSEDSSNENKTDNQTEQLKETASDLDKSEKLDDKKVVNGDKSMELEDGECSDTASESECESDASTSTLSDEDAVAKHHPPCMRVIVRETNLPKLKVGSLFLITKDGGTIGREGDQHTILIRDHNVSRNHLDIRYDADKKTYLATDLGSKNGTILNGTRMSESQEISGNIEVLHGSTIQLGETKLLCHIHPGNDTCGHCEPGLLMEMEDKEKKTAYTRTCSVQKQHQLELARLKNIYAPKLLEIDDKPYNDRAQTRRETVGSMHHSEKTQTADLDTSISQENKGFKLLQKMGWSKGEGLGKDNQGDTEPVPLVSNDGKSGLGTSGGTGAPSTVPTPRKSNTIAAATIRLAARTKMLQPPAKAFQDNLNEDSE